MTESEIDRLSPENLLRILRIMKRVMGILEVKSLCHNLAEAVVSEVNTCNHVSVYLLYRHSGYLSEVALAGADTEEFRRRGGEGRVQSMDQGILGHVARTGEPYLTGNVLKDPYYVCAFTPDMRSELAVPIRVDEEVIGVLNVESKHENAFTEVELCVFEVLGDLVGNCISNSVLHEQVREEEMEISQAHQEAERFERTFQALARLEADAVLTVAADGRVEFLEGAAADTVGPAARDATGRRAADLFDGIPTGSFAGAGASGPAAAPMALRVRESGGPGRAVSARILPLLDEQRRFCGNLVLLRKP